ncbi:Probable RNA-directed DNA polymerase from transposon BS [Eumeta japonica]|uniref:Probable RNA-directed DNA polymerase from transposon BS n=1 Tax=Eumeta variegata TaxID=151549 RepID=A0A4C1VGA8_EUMVA|nr:Probable RNA-directed DNA polymerase from transposon BS [Eumeta japonica]
MLSLPLRTTSLISVASRKRFSKTSLEPKDDLAPVSLSEVQTLVKSLNTRRHRASMRSPPRKGLIIDEQFGFRPAHSCPQQVLRLVEYVSEALKPNSTVAVFFDVAKAFDRVWRRHERTHSTRRLIRAGVPQGSTLSPLLYSAYTNDVPRPSSSGVQLALFADDTALFYGNRNRSTRFTLLPLQRAIDELGQWFRKWRIEVNPTNQQPYNSSMVRLESTHCRQNTPNLKMLDAIIPWQRNYKYLGVTLDKIYTSEIISSVLEILHFSTKQGSGPCSVEKVNYLDVINVPYTKCALGR